MFWNYRVIRHDGDPDPRKHYIALHEVFYNDAGAPWSWTAEPVTFICEGDESKEALARMLKYARRDIRRSDLLSETALLKLIAVVAQ